MVNQPEAGVVLASEFLGVWLEITEQIQPKRLIFAAEYLQSLNYVFGTQKQSRKRCLKIISQVSDYNARHRIKIILVSDLRLNHTYNNAKFETDTVCGS
uniref:Uncharacterized protein n=1 Tax=Tetranychus urticae TaxID=32264 RepID=T1KI04_TETUR